MFSRILVPVDLSDRNGAAVEAAAELAAASSGVVIVLHVIEELENVPRSELEDFYQGLRGRAEGVLDGLRGQLEGRGVPVETAIRMGKPGTEILRFAEDESCDLAVMRSHVIDREHPTRGIGTTSHQIALAARCPVLLVR
jgi:nucleotide-binding universal stress UspA family protein